MKGSIKKTTGIYQCHPDDDIKNLRIRIKIWKTTTDKAEEESYDFKWQEKVFSVEEVEKYKGVNEENASPFEKRCKKKLEKWMRMHHKMLKEHRLYSITDEEISMDSDEQDLVTDFVGERLTATEINFREAQQYYSDDPVSNDRAGGQRASAKLIEDPTYEELLRQFFRSPKSQRMRIMFDSRINLQQQEPQQPPTPAEGQEPDAANEEEQKDKSQKVLCTLTFDPKDRQLSLNPDFTKQPLILGNWRYTIENASTRMSEAELARVFALETERVKLKSEARQLFRPIDFELPAVGQALRVVVRGEIVSAKHFELDDLYVQFFLDLPNDWWVPQPRGLSGVTQICATRTETVLHPMEREDNVAFFSFPFEFELYFQRTVPASDTDYEFPRWPVMYFEVMSQDRWTRHRTEGYGHTTMPDTAGSHEMRISCWRPSGNSAVCELRRYFIGGTPALEDPTFAKAPSDFSGEHLSKFGFNTDTTGELLVRMHCIHQSTQFLERGSAGSKVRGSTRIGETFSKAGPSQADLLRALNRFRAARVQLINVHKTATLSMGQSSGGHQANGHVPPMPRQSRTGDGGGGYDEHDDEEREEEEEQEENGGLLDTRTRLAEQYSRQLREE